MLLASLTLLAAELVRQGLLPNIPDFPRLPSYFQSRTEAASALPMRIVCYVKEYIEVPQRCLTFDENTGVPRPIKPGEGFDFQYGLVMEVQPSPIQSFSGFSSCFCAIATASGCIWIPSFVRRGKRSERSVFRARRSRKDQNIEIPIFSRAIRPFFQSLDSSAIRYRANRSVCAMPSNTFRLYAH